MILYFDKFPLIRYDINKDGNRKLATDILTRIGFRDKVKNQALAFQDYYVEEGMTPELVALDLYGQTDLHWVVLMFNDIFDPYHEWPMDDNELEDWLDKKFPDMALYVGLTCPNFVEGNQVTYDTTERAVIGSWDATTRKLSLYNETKPFSVSSIVGTTLTTEDKGGTAFSAPVTRAVAFQREALHHFENPGGTAELDGWSSPPFGVAEYQVPVGQTGAQGSYTESVVPLGDTLIDNYVYSTDGEDAKSRVVSIHEYYKTLNNERREIKVLQPRYVDVVVSQFSKIMSEMK